MKFNCENCGKPVSPSTPISALGDKAVGLCCAKSNTAVSRIDDGMISIETFRLFFKGLGWREHAPGVANSGNLTADIEMFNPKVCWIFWNRGEVKQAGGSRIVTVNPNTLEWRASANTGTGHQWQTATNPSFQVLSHYIQTL